MVSISPGLIAAAHVLHRLLAPRHPPCALVLLISKNTLCCRYGVFKVHAGRRPALQRTTTPRHGLSKLNSVRRTTSRSTLFPGEPSHRTRISRDPHQRAAHSRSECLPTSSTPAGVNRSCIPRKEVIQPQLPLRLPCYDFTPIINPTFDGCLPCGLAHRLRVLPTFVV